MAVYKTTLQKLHTNLNTLREREAKHAGNVPLDLLNQIADHETAITLTEQALTGELTETEWREALKPLLVSLDQAADLVNETELLHSFLDKAVATFESSMYQLMVRSPTASPQPYKFLYPFALEDADIFKGRDTAIEELSQIVLRDRLTILHAPSGAGKSSLLHAGLAPHLIRQGRLPVFARVYQAPNLAVKRAIAPPSLGPWPHLLADLTLPEFLASVCHRLSRQTQELVIILDQFEEFFIFHPLPVNRAPFINTLATCLDDKALPVRFIIALRKDYYSDLAEFQSRIPTILYNEYRLQPLTRTEAEIAITAPVTQRGLHLTYEPALIETLLDDLSRAEIELPHLQIVCTELFERLPPHQTTILLSTYEELGRTEGILNGYLGNVLAQLPVGQRTIAKAVLKELVSSEATRRMVSRGLLQARLEANPDDLADVLNKLVNARLLHRNEVEGESVYDLAHEYLIKEIITWLDQADLAFKQTEELLRREVASWQAKGTLIARDRLELIHEHQGLFTRLNIAEAELLCRSAVAHNFALDTWATVAHKQGIDIWPMLQPALENPAPDIRANIVAIMPVLGEAALPALTQALQDDVPLVRVQAIKAMERLNTDQARQTLQTNLRHEVYIPPAGNDPAFYLDRYPVTNAAYEIFLKFNPNHQPPPHWPDRTAPSDLSDHPVVRVSWSDAQAYAAWAGKRLPTASEWQRAAGGAQSRRYPWGHRFAPDRCNTREAGVKGTTSVGTYSPRGDSPYGVGDMSGNVWEWLADPAGVENQYRQLRGGAWFYSAEFARISFDQFYRQPNQRQDVIGFRLCLDASPAAEI
jgi:formylglycine-generating enzyme required for sulfatase activity